MSADRENGVEDLVRVARETASMMGDVNLKELTTEQRTDILWGAVTGCLYAIAGLASDDGEQKTENDTTPTSENICEDDERSERKT